jgi:ABC-type multidrug transport system ATPase subunit
MSSAVAVDGLWKFYGDYPALRDIRLEAGEGACLALIGRNSPPHHRRLLAARQR